MPYKIRPRRGRKSVKMTTARRTRQRLGEVIKDGGGGSVTMFPPTVNINITTGSAGRTEYPEIAWINKKTLENVNVNTNWVDAIEAAFGRKISASDFYVTKKSRKGMIPPRHQLTIPIRKAIENYKLAMDCYNFCIRKYYVDGRSEKAMPMRVAVRKSRRAKATTLASAKSKSASRIQNGGIDLNQQEQRPARRTAQIVNQGNRAVRFEFPISRGGDGGGNHETRGNIPMGIIIKQEISDSSGNNQSAMNVTQNHSVLTSASQSQRQRPPALSTSSDQNISILKDKVSKENEHATSTGGENDEVEMADDNDDAVSIAESQLDCEDKGIKYEDMRTGFLKRADSISDEQLFQAREDVLKLKSSDVSRGRNKWLDWNIACPAAATLIRELFDV